MMKKNGVKLAGLVLTGTLTMGTVVPVTAAPDITTASEDAAQQKEEERIEKVVFLNTAEEEKDKEEGPYDAEAVDSLEAALSQFGPLAEDIKKMEEKEAEEAEKQREKEDWILVLCGKTTLTDEEKELLEENKIVLMQDKEYEELLKQRKEAEEKAKEEAAQKETVQPQDPFIVPAAPAEDTDEELPPMIWQAPEIAIPSSPAASEETPVTETPDMDASDAGDAAGDDQQAAETGDQAEEEDAPAEEPFSGVLLPGFSLPSGSTAVADDETAAEDTEDAQAEEVTEETEEELEVIEVEEVAPLFGMFLLEDPVIIDASEETADLSDTNPLVKEENPTLYALPGLDLVGNGTSGVGGGTSGSGSTSGGSTSGGSASSGNTGSGAASNSGSGSASGSGSSTQQKPAQSGSAAQAAPSTSSGSKNNNSIIKTGDASHGIFWGLSTAISGAMAVFFAGLWKKLENEEES